MKKMIYIMSGLFALSTLNAMEPAKKRANVIVTLNKVKNNSSGNIGVYAGGDELSRPSIEQSSPLVIIKPGQTKEVKFSYNSREKINGQLIPLRNVIFKMAHDPKYWLLELSDNADSFNARFYLMTSIDESRDKIRSRPEETIPLERNEDTQIFIDATINGPKDATFDMYSGSGSAQQVKELFKK